MIEIEGPDGVIYEFPEGTDEQVMLNAMRQVYSAGQQAQTEQPQPEQAEPTWGESVGTWLNRAGESMTLGLIGDEVNAALYGMLPGRTYEGELARFRQNEEDLGGLGRFTADIAGGLTGAIATAPLALAAMPASMGARAAASGALGAGAGATQGFMEGEGFGDRVGDALLGGAIGGAVGAAAPMAAAGLRKAGGAVRDIVGGGFDTLRGRASQSRADRAIAETLSRSGTSTSDVAAALAKAAQEGQPEYRIMDALGVPGQRRASGVVRAGGDGAQELAEFLSQRQLDQGRRVGGFVEEAMGFGGNPAASGALSEPTRSAAQMGSALTNARGAAANTAYTAAREGAAPVDVRGVLAAIDDRIGPMQGSGVSGDGIDSVLSKYRSRLASQPGGKAFPGASSVELSDFSRILGVKQDLGDEIGEAVRKGQNNRARELMTVQRELDAALEAASPDYRAANDAFARDSRVIDALETGSGMYNRGRAADTVPQFQSMTPDQQQAARIGYGDRALERIGGIEAETTNRMRPFASSDVREEMQAMALDPELWANRQARENAMWEVQNRALGGSRTADNMQDVAGIGPMANIGRALRDAANFQFGAAAGNIASAIGPAVSGMNEPTRQLVARALMSQDANALTGAVEQQLALDTRQRIIEALIGSASRGISN